jgi:DNA polymerase I-like protein with 3'-5' exonuclease and polymerase domains
LIVPKNKPYAGVNYIVQGTEGDIVKRAICSCHKILKDSGSKTRMMLPVHDEILFRFPIRSAPPLLDLTQAMEEAGTYYGVKCKAKAELIVDNWASGKSIPNNYYQKKASRFKVQI